MMTHNFTRKEYSIDELMVTPKDSTSNHIVLFDMDKTLVNGTTSSLWMEFLYQKKLISSEEMKIRQNFDLSYDKGALDPMEFYNFEISIIKRIDSDKIYQLREEYFNSLIIPIIYRKGFDLIKHYQAQEKTIVGIISATVSFLAEPVAKYLGVGNLICTQMEIKDNLFTGEICEGVCMNAGKVDCLEKWLQNNKLNSTHLTFYTDSINDLPLLLKVHSPIVVHPDKFLEAEARQRNWSIRDFG
jgi:HAD superfamily hydrolase (TIGR01490 family)